MKIHIGKEDCKFYINKEKKVTVCVINIVNNRHIQFAAHDFLAELEYDGIKIWPQIKSKLLTSYVGIAKCSPQDEWNEEIGRKIAFARAKIAFYKDFFRAFREYIIRINDAARRADEVYTIIFDKIYSNVEKIVDKI